MKTKSLFCLILIFMAGCKTDPLIQPAFNNAFSLDITPEWTLVNLQGTDSYVGYYESSAGKINFDFGRVSFKSVDEIKKESSVLYYEETVIDNCEAKIIKEQRTEGMRLSAFIDKRDGAHKTWLYTYNPSSDAKFIGIFKTHRFK